MTKSATVLVVDDDAALRRALTRVLKRAGYTVRAAPSVPIALALIDQIGIPDLILSDIVLNGDTGIDLLRAVRARDLDVPVVFLTGHPSITDAAHAVELGAFRYLIKPVANRDLLAVLKEAIRTRAFLRIHQQLARTSGDEAFFQRALDGLWMAYQPIVAAGTRQLFGYEALMRTSETGIDIGQVLHVAERIGALHMLGQAVRERVAEAAEETRIVGATIFVNLHVEDLLDRDLYDPAAPLSRHGHRIVLEITERATLSTIADLRERLAALRAMNFRIAIDDLGAGYAGMSYVAAVQPDVLKIDMSLIRGVDTDRVRQRIITSLTTLAGTLGIKVVAEGVETATERDALVMLGCDYLQGYVLARPGPPFPVFEWR